jgi:hypothetical protein
MLLNMIQLQVLRILLLHRQAVLAPPTRRTSRFGGQRNQGNGRDTSNGEKVETFLPRFD